MVYAEIGGLFISEVIFCWFCVRISGVFDENIDQIFNIFNCLVEMEADLPVKQNLENKVQECVNKAVSSLANQLGKYWMIVWKNWRIRLIKIKKNSFGQWRKWYEYLVIIRKDKRYCKKGKMDGDKENENMRSGQYSLQKKKKRAVGKAIKAVKRTYRAVACDESSGSDDVVISCSSDMDDSVNEVEWKKYKKESVGEEQDLVVKDPLGECMFDPHTIQHPLSPQWVPADHVAEYGSH